LANNIYLLILPQKTYPLVEYQSSAMDSKVSVTLDPKNGSCPEEFERKRSTGVGLVRFAILTLWVR
jgi:hypothetical protein